MGVRSPIMESDARMLGLEIKTKDEVSTKSRQDGQLVTCIFSNLVGQISHTGASDTDRTR